MDTLKFTRGGAGWRRARNSSWSYHLSQQWSSPHFSTYNPTFPSWTSAIPIPHCGVHSGCLPHFCIQCSSHGPPPQPCQNSFLPTGPVKEHQGPMGVTSEDRLSSGPSLLTSLEAAELASQSLVVCLQIICVCYCSMSRFGTQHCFVVPCPSSCGWHLV